MMKRRYILLCCVIALLANCREKYVLPNVGPAGGFLVVEGFINSGAGATEVRLSRSLRLVDTVDVSPELKAQVWVQGKDNSQQLLAEQGNGLYSGDNLAINPAQEYRLYIMTDGGKEYASAYSRPLNTPPIDAINWERLNGGVEVFVNTHDATGNVKYYRWAYEETWEFHSTLYSSLMYLLGPDGKPYDVDTRPYEDAKNMFFCWQYENSSRILIGNSANYTRDSIHLALQFIPRASWKISVLYSIKIKQYAISSAEHEFLRRMKKNTEQVGSLFDAQPSELVGNIQCLSNPGELVVGFVGISNMQEKRIFINNSEVPDWDYNLPCQTMEIPNNPDSMAMYTTAVPILPTEIFGIRILRFTIADSYCADCRTRGFNIKPSYWP